MVQRLSETIVNSNKKHIEIRSKLNIKEGDKIIIPKRFYKIVDDLMLKMVIYSCLGNMLLNNLYRIIVTFRACNSIKTTSSIIFIKEVFMFKTGYPEKAGMSPERVKRYERLVENWVEEKHIQGLVYLVARKGLIISYKALGSLSPEEDSPNIEFDTIFPISSISKPITATCIMILVEEGIIDPYHPVSMYIPEFRGEGKQSVRIFHLMTHTSGLRDEDIRSHNEKKKESAEIPQADSTQDSDLNEWLFLGYDAPLWKEPGAEMSYCGYGIELLGEIIRRVSGKPLYRFAREKIFEPLGMNDTDFIVPDSKIHRVIRRKPFEIGQEDWFSSIRSLKSPSAAGGVYSTAMDMAIFGQMFLNNGIYNGIRILSPICVAEMTKNHIPGISSRFGEEVFKEAVWDYCWNVHGEKKDFTGALHSSQTFNHTGGGGTVLWIDPVYETVTSFFAVDNEQRYGLLFNNAVMASIVE